MFTASTSLGTDSTDKSDRSFPGNPVARRKFERHPLLAMHLMGLSAVGMLLANETFVQTASLHYASISDSRVEKKKQTSKQSGTAFTSIFPKANTQDDEQGTTSDSNTLESVYPLSHFGVVMALPPPIPDLDSSTDSSSSAPSSSSTPSTTTTTTSSSSSSFDSQTGFADTFDYPAFLTPALNKEPLFLMFV